MRWLAVWIVLTGVFFAGQLVAPLFSGGAGSWAYTREDLAHLVAIPLIQLAALWIVVLVRRHGRGGRGGRDDRGHRNTPTPPPAPETTASHPAAEP